MPLPCQIHKTGTAGEKPARPPQLPPPVEVSTAPIIIRYDPEKGGWQYINPPTNPHLKPVQVPKRPPPLRPDWLAKEAPASPPKPPPLPKRMPAQNSQLPAGRPFKHPPVPMYVGYQPPKPTAPSGNFVTLKPPPPPPPPPLPQAKAKVFDCCC